MKDIMRGKLGAPKIVDLSTFQAELAKTQAGLFCRAFSVRSRRF